MQPRGRGFDSRSVSFPPPGLDTNPNPNPCALSGRELLNVAKTERFIATLEEVLGNGNKMPRV